MSFLKSFFPFSFKATGLVSFIITLIVYAVIDVVCCFAIGLLAKIPVINLVTGLLGSLLSLYGLIGIVLAILVFIKVLK